MLIIYVYVSNIYMLSILSTHHHLSPAIIDHLSTYPPSISIIYLFNTVHISVLSIINLLSISIIFQLFIIYHIYICMYKLLSASICPFTYVAIICHYSIRVSHFLQYTASTWPSALGPWCSWQFSQSRKSFWVFKTCLFRLPWRY